MSKRRYYILIFCLIGFRLTAIANTEWGKYPHPTLDRNIEEIYNNIKDSSSCLQQINYTKARLLCDSLNLPKEFSIIPFALNNHIDQEKRFGAWRLSVPISIYYGLKINQFYDERLDVNKSTDAALRYISDLYKIYNDYWLTFLAFSHSPAAVNSILQIIGTNDINISDFYNSRLFDNSIITHFATISNERIFLDIHNLLSQKSNIQTNLTSYITTQNIYTDILLNEINTTIEKFRLYNPCIRPNNEIIPIGCTINIPTLDSDLFIAKIDTIYIKSKALTDSISVARNIEIEKQKEIKKQELEAKRYTVKPGDTLGHIALKYGISVNLIKKRNNLRTDILQIGQILLISI